MSISFLGNIDCSSYIALNMTPSIDSYWVGAVPKLSQSYVS